MTLVLTQVTDRYVLQISDRLVSYAQTGAPFDSGFNKTILFIAKDAIATFSFYGAAFVGSKPTDEWLVEKLQGMPVSKMGDDERIGPALYSRRLWKVKKWPRISMAIWRLISEIDLLYKAQPRFPRLGCVMGGWRWNKKGMCRPIGFHFDRFNNLQGIKGWLPRYFWGNSWLTVAPDGYLSLAERKKMTDETCALSAVDAQSYLANVIRSVSSKGVPVGPNCMSMLIEPPGFGKCHITFLPATPHMKKAFPFKDQTEVYYSPWIISSAFTLAPAVYNKEASYTVTTDGFTINLATTALPGERLGRGFISAAPPRKPPK